MCRISFIYGENMELAKKIIQATVLASKNDKYKDALGYGPEHGDGWGTISFSLSPDNTAKKAYYYATIDPIFEDSDGVNELIELVTNSQRTLTVIHSRYTSAGSSNVFNTHPFHFAGKNFEMWFVHNGTMNKTSLAKKLELSPPKEVSDTYLLGSFIYQGVEKLDLKHLVNQFKKATTHTKSAMNTMSIFHTVDGKLYATITSYVAKNLLQNREAVNYYKLFAFESEEIFTVVSSTIADIIQDKFQKKEELLNKMQYLEFNKEHNNKQMIIKTVPLE